MEKMITKGFGLLLLLVVGHTGYLRAQSGAALEKVEARYNPAQLADLQAQTHYKYVGLLLYYASSFQIVEHGQPRAATEPEIAALDIDQYASLRTEDRDVTVHDVGTGLDLLLLSRHAFETLVLGVLDDADTAAYLAYKAAALATQGKSTE